MTLAKLHAAGGHIKKILHISIDTKNVFLMYSVFPFGIYTQVFTIILVKSVWMIYSIYNIYFRIYIVPVLFLLEIFKKNYYK